MKARKGNNHVNRPSEWKVAIQREIESLRAVVSVFVELATGVNIKTKRAGKKSNKGIESNIL